jgi:hypothetical protein
VTVVAVRVQLLPDVIDASFVLTFSGGGGLIATFVAATLGFEPERLARLVVFGNLGGAVLGSCLLVLAGLGVL